MYVCNCVYIASVWPYFLTMPVVHRIIRIDRKISRKKKSTSLIGLFQFIQHSWRAFLSAHCKLFHSKYVLIPVGKHTHTICVTLIMHFDGSTEVNANVFSHRLCTMTFFAYGFGHTQIHSQSRKAKFSSKSHVLVSQAANGMRNSIMQQIKMPRLKYIRLWIRLRLSNHIPTNSTPHSRTIRYFEWSSYNNIFFVIYVCMYVCVCVYVCMSMYNIINI